MILLDTCVLFWLEEDPEKISQPARELIGNPGNLCFASSISSLELGLKVAGNLLKLPLNPGEWVQEVCSRRSITELKVDFRVAGSSALLPWIHRDPFDRILIASALQHSLILVTPDPVISRYPQIKVCW
jgi:PIN domain nuclease of toxin-antitoxin system